MVRSSKSRRVYFGFALWTLLFSTSCQENIDKNSIRSLLLRSNELQRTAHLENNAKMLVKEISDSITTMQDGQISKSSNQDTESMFSLYFDNVEYITWDDTYPPEITIAEDGSMASVNVRKLIDYRFKDENEKWGDHQYQLFAWNAIYQKMGDDFKIIQITSTNKTIDSLQAEKSPFSFSEIYATIDEPDLIPEGLAFDNITNTVYLSSTYKQKIIAIKSDGTYSDFQTEEADGLWSTVGMEVDEDRRRLWVVSANLHEVLPLKNPDPATEWQSKIYEYKLPDGELMNIYEPEIPGQQGFNDLTVSNEGIVYVTESAGGRVYRLNPENKEFQKLPLIDSTVVFPNGITISEDNRFLYITTGNGILQFDIQSEKQKFLSKPNGVLDYGIDGLAYYKGSLIANQPYRNKILQFVLDEESTTITSQRILEANHPDFDQPSTGEVAGSSFIFLANAQMRSGFDNGKLKPMDSLESVKILKLNLDFEFN